MRPGGGGSVGRAVLVFRFLRAVFRVAGLLAARSTTAAACTRPVTPNLRKMLVTCTPAVRGLMNNPAPICALVHPVASSQSTAKFPHGQPLPSPGATERSADTGIIYT